MKRKMTYVQFYNQWHKFACFSTQQVLAVYPRFNRSNYYRWQLRGYIIFLRQEWYAFADYQQQANYANYFAGQIYAPSYISLHSALAFYGIIPESVVEITSVSTQKTTRFTNAFATYSYQTVRPELFWGYEAKTMQDGKIYMMATPEKALIDLLHLYPQYKSEQDWRDLRLDEDWMRDELNRSRMDDYMSRINSPTLTKRMSQLLTLYSI